MNQLGSVFWFNGKRSSRLLFLGMFDVELFVGFHNTVPILPANCLGFEKSPLKALFRAKKQYCCFQLFLPQIITIVNVEQFLGLTFRMDVERVASTNANYKIAPWTSSISQWIGSTAGIVWNISTFLFKINYKDSRVELLHYLLDWIKIAGVHQPPHAKAQCIAAATVF